MVILENAPKSPVVELEDTLFPGGAGHWWICILWAWMLYKASMEGESAQIDLCVSEGGAMQ